MASLSSRWPARLVPVLALLAACGDNAGRDAPPDAAPLPTVDAAVSIDAQVVVDAPVVVPDGPTATCDPTTVLPTNFRPIPLVSTGTVNVASNNNITTGTIDATAGGAFNNADKPYIYVNLATGTRADVTDLESRTSDAWDIALKRSSLRVNGGDSGSGHRTLAVVEAATLAEVTAGPADGYASDDFTTEDCKLASLDGGEPLSAFAQWYNYNDETHIVTPKPQVYVLERADGSRTAFRMFTYYGDPASPTRSAYYKVEWKQLPPK